MEEERYQQEYDSWLEQTRKQQQQQQQLQQQSVYGGRNGYSARRRLPSENVIKKKPWHSLITGWSSDDLAQKSYGPVISNGWSCPPQRFGPQHTTRPGNLDSVRLSIGNIKLFKGRGGRQLPMVPGSNQNKTLVNQRSLPEDYSDSYLRESYSTKLTSYLRSHHHNLLPAQYKQAMSSYMQFYVWTLRI